MNPRPPPTSRVRPQNHVGFGGPADYPPGVDTLCHPARSPNMAAAVVRRNDTAFTVTVEVPYKGSMLDAEEAIQQALNEAGVAATEESLSRFDADGDPIRLGPAKFTSMGKVRKEYQ